MTKVDRLAHELAHALAMKGAAVAAHNPRARDYWFDVAARVRAELNQALFERGYDRPAPEQPPLFVDDLKGTIKAGKKPK